jgi:hypothetical protein
MRTTSAIVVLHRGHARLRLFERSGTLHFRLPSSDNSPAFCRVLRVDKIKILVRRYVSLTTSWTAPLSQASMAERPIALPPVGKGARGHANRTILERRAV